MREPLLQVRRPGTELRPLESGKVTTDLLESSNGRYLNSIERHMTRIRQR